MPENKSKKIGIIGDVHGEDKRLEESLSVLLDKGCQKIVCTGDIVDGVGCPNRSAKLLQENKVITVRGNHDRWIIENKARHIKKAHSLHDLTADTLAFLKKLPTQATINLGETRILVCHGVGDNDLAKIWPGTDRLKALKSELLDKIISSKRYNYMINGHIHFRTMIHFRKMTLINAGTIAGDFWPGISILDLETNQVHGYHFKDRKLKLRISRNLSGKNYTIWENTQSFTGNWDPVRLF